MNFGFGSALKDWRQQRRLSQLELGLSANVSARHICFLETGRAQPSRSMVLRLCDELEVPRSARNQLLNAAGLAPAYAERALSAADMAPVQDAVDWLLQRHAPYPALALDRHWVIKRLNPPARQLLAGMEIDCGHSMLEAILDNPKMQAAIENLTEVQHHLLQRLRTESAHLGGDRVLDEAIERLAKQCDTQPARPPGVLQPFVPTRYRTPTGIISLFSTFTQFGTADDIALAELRIEMFFPADQASRQFLEGLGA